MNAELLAMLGSVPGGSSRRENEPKNLLSFKAGKMIADRQPNGKYMVSADPRRGTLEVNWTASASSTSSAGVLKLEWKDRRTRAVVDSLTIFPEDDCTYSRVDTGTDRDGDRVYVLQYGNASDRRFFFWMQEKEDGNEDEEFCVKINTFMADPDEASAAANGGSGSTADKTKASSKKGSGAGATDRSGALDSNALMSIMQGLNTSEGAAGNGNSNAPQVDALSNILENLGMPQNSANISAASSSAAPSPAAASTMSSIPVPAATPTASASVGLTLSDLQGAMAGLATTSPPNAAAAMFAAAQQPGPSLAEVVTPENIIESGILSNESIKAKLIELLPENQRSEELLMENLRSPQVKQCLKSLSAALCDDEGGSMDSFNSILANFQLKPEDGMLAMAAGNPIEAFLQCVLASVQREKDEEVKEEDGDAEMKE